MRRQGITLASVLLARSTHISVWTLQASILVRRICSAREGSTCWTWAPILPEAATPLSAALSASSTLLLCPFCFRERRNGLQAARGFFWHSWCVGAAYGCNLCPHYPFTTPYKHVLPDCSMVSRCVWEWTGIRAGVSIKIRPSTGQDGRVLCLAWQHYVHHPNCCVEF